MATLYIILGLIAILVLARALTRSKINSHLQNHKIEIPVKVTLSHHAGEIDGQFGVNIDKDEWEGSFWEVNKPLPTESRLRIKYTDGAGRKTDRTVDVRQFGSLGQHTLMIGHCNMRNATRTFRSDRVDSCVDEETGEVIDDLQSYLFSKYEKSADKTKDQLFEVEYDTLRVLLYVGKADGQLRAAEKAVIRDTCAEISNDSRLTVAHIEELFASMDVPTLQAFKLAVGRLAKREQSALSIVMSAAEKIVATQKTIHQAEQEALDYMKNRFSKNSNAA